MLGAIFQSVSSSLPLFDMGHGQTAALRVFQHKAQDSIALTLNFHRTFGFGDRLDLDSRL